MCCGSIRIFDKCMWLFCTYKRGSEGRICMFMRLVFMQVLISVGCPICLKWLSCCALFRFCVEQLRKNSILGCHWKV